MAESHAKFAKKIREAVVSGVFGTLVSNTLLDACKHLEQQQIQIDSMAGQLDQLEQLTKALNPVREWYGGGTEGNRSDLEILTDAIGDLQKDRAKVLQQQAELAKHCWIPVSERLPEPDENGVSPCVLVFDNGNPVNWGKATYVNYHRGSNGFWASEADVGEPTHWKPIWKPIILPAEKLLEKE